jgi:hypothetical protein
VAGGVKATTSLARMSADFFTYQEYQKMCRFVYHPLWLRVRRTAASIPKGVARNPVSESCNLI